MFVIKWLSMISIFSICSYIGILKSRSYENRVKELNKFQNSLIMFKSKIEFTYEPLKNIFEEISKVIYLDKENIFKQVLKNSDNIYNSWCESVENNSNELLQEDKDIIKMMGKLLGKTDIKGQVNEIELTKKLIDKQIEKLEIEKNKNVKLYKTMGVIIGLGICIILV